MSKNNWSFGKDINLKAGLFTFSLVFTAFVGPFGRSVVSAPEQLSKITVTLAATPSSWPLYIAKEGGYYRQNGLEVNFGFGLHPAPLAMLVSGQAQMTNYTLEQAMQAASKDSSLVIIGSLSKKTLFALIANKTISTVPELKGKRIGISQIGDGPYNYSIKILSRFGLTVRDVQWVPIGSNERGPALVSGRIDATMLNAPAYFRLEEAGYRVLANIGDYDDIYTPTVQLYSKRVLAQDPSLPRRLLMSEAQAIERFYRDKSFAVKAFLAYDHQDLIHVERIYDQYVRMNAFERVPYVLAAPVQYTIDSQSDSALADQMKRFDFRSVVDNKTVDELIHDGFFGQLFGQTALAEQENKSKLAFR